MVNKKKELRDKLIHKKKEDRTLRKELLGIDKHSQRAIEIRKLLGIATMQDILGDKYPLRVCKHCGKRACNIVELQAFSKSSSSKHGYQNICLECINLLRLAPNSNIVGVHQLLKVYKQTCEVCAKSYDTSSKLFGISNHSYDKVCRICLGTHVVVMGMAVPIVTEPIPIIAYNTITKETSKYTSLRQCATTLGIALSSLSLAIKTRKPYEDYRFFLERCNDRRQEFINKMIAIHGDTYSYTNVLYLSRSYHVAITCKEHGDWLATPNNLLQYHTGCPKCAERPGFKTRYYLEEPTTLYYVYFPTLELWKIGVTKNNVSARFINDRLPVEILLEVTYPTAKLAYDMETTLLRATKSLTYDGPKVLSSGNTELRIRNTLSLLKGFICMT